MKNSDYFKGKLLALRDELDNRMQKIDIDIKHEGITTDLYDQAIELENEEVLNALRKASKHEYAMIDVALQRIASGTYFTCVSCGEMIPEARLEMLPFVSQCVNCAEKRD